MLNSNNIFNNGGSIGIGTAAPDASAKLDVASTSQGLLLPRMSTAQRSAIPSPGLSLLVFNTTTNCLEIWSGANWQNVYCLCTAPAAPTATAATNVTSTSFTANWTAVVGATTYFLDVSTNSLFSSFVSGYNNLNVGNVTSTSVTGLTSNTTYFYRVRAGNTCGTSGNSNTITVTTLNCPGPGTQTFNFTGGSQTSPCPPASPRSPST